MVSRGLGGKLRYGQAWQARYGVSLFVEVSCGMARLGMVGQVRHGMVW